MPQKKQESPSTQSFIEIDKIYDGIVYLKDKSLRKVIIASSINFALLSDDEQNSIILGFQNLINGVDYPIQILVQSRRVDLVKYLKNIEEIGNGTKDAYIKENIMDYHSFLEQITQRANLMDKKFYLVIPFFPSSVASLQNNAADNGSSILYQRVSAVEIGLKNLGINCIPLDTQGLIELYYTSYNPGTDKFNYIGDSSSLDRAVVTKNFEGDKNA